MKSNNIGGSILIILAILILIVLLGLFMSVGNESSTEKQNATQKADTSSAVANSADSLSIQIERLKEISDRTKEISISMKTHYASQDQVDQGVKDLSLLTRLSMLKKSIEDCVSKEERNVMTEANKLYPIVDAQCRAMYASSREQKFMDRGMNVRVSATGQGNKTLKIVYSLMSQPMVYQFQNNSEVPETASSFGFNKIIYTNGFQGSFDETWIINLDN